MIRQNVMKRTAEKKTSDEMAVEMYSMNSTICKYCNNMYTITFKCDYI